MKRSKRDIKNSQKPEAFSAYFAGLYGDRWPALVAALAKDPAMEVLKNPFGLQDYRLDRASLLPARMLAPEKDMSIADFCASPGGKSLSMIFALNGEAKFFLNDLSPGRVQRLKAIMHDCLPTEVQARVVISKSDASRWGMTRAGHFDRILVDAPCSGERHLMEKPNELARWSLKGSKRLVIRQHALLCAAVDSLDEGGRLVYSTCSINPIENDGVIARVLKSRGEKIRVVNYESDMGERTEHGWLVLPDQAECGPIYAALLERI